MRTSTLPPTPTPPSTLSSLLRASLFRGEGKREVRGESSESEDVVSPFMYGTGKSKQRKLPLSLLHSRQSLFAGSGFRHSRSQDLILARLSFPSTPPLLSKICYSVLPPRPPVLSTTRWTSTSAIFSDEIYIFTLVTVAFHPSSTTPSPHAHKRTHTSAPNLQVEPPLPGCLVSPLPTAE